MTKSNVLLQMDDYIQSWKTGADERALFLQCYRMMTANMLESLEQGAFKNNTWTSQLVHHFADYYFHAVRAYEDQAPALPLVWEYAFDAANKPELAPIQQLLLGVNAHINYDLVLALYDLLEPEWNALPEASRQPYFDDYCYVNTIISQTIDSVQDQVLEPAQPAMRLVDDLMGRVDEWLLGQLIFHWRDQVWENTLKLLEAQPGKARTAVVQAVETRAFQRAEAIAGKDWPLGLRMIV